MGQGQKVHSSFDNVYLWQCLSSTWKTQEGSKWRQLECRREGQRLRQRVENHPSWECCYWGDGVNRKATPELRGQEQRAVVISGWTIVGYLGKIISSCREPWISSWEMVISDTSFHGLLSYQLLEVCARLQGRFSVLRVGETSYIMLNDITRKAWKSLFNYPFLIKSCKETSSHSH